MGVVWVRGLRSMEGEGWEWASNWGEGLTQPLIRRWSQKGVTGKGSRRNGIPDVQPTCCKVNVTPDEITSAMHTNLKINMENYSELTRLGLKKKEKKEEEKKAKTKSKTKTLRELCVCVCPGRWW